MRSYWHPYTDDTSPVLVRHVEALPALIGKDPDTPGIGLMYHAFRHRRPFHSPTFGCLVHTD